ncbi:MAG TPA: diguanylate cyclase [Terriglobales bacterium]|jgi:diguanylate cyclase (GGDEF)-like protein|nr:diguanylate cyclase [Terriglobales bacterium]
MSSELAKRLERAEKALAKGKPDLALEDYLAVLREDPKNDKLREAAADLCVTLNRPADAATLLSPLFDRQASIGDTPHAIITFKKVARMGTPTVEQWFRFGQLIERSSRREALDAYEAALNGFKQLGRRLEAYPVLERIVALDPTEQNYQRQGELARELGDSKAAAAAFFEAGRIARQAGNDGMTWFQQAYAADPENLPAALAYARGLLDRGDAARVISVLERFGAIAGSNLELGEIYGRALLAAGKPKQAEPFLWPLYVRDPSQVACVEQLLRGFLKNQEHAPALALAQRLEASEHKLGRRREFAKTLKDVADQYPLDLEFLEYLVQVFNNASREHDYCKTLLKLFDLYYAAGNYLKAGDSLDRAAEVDPYEPGHEQRLERLRGKIDNHLFNAIANRFQTASSVRGPEAQPAPEDEQTTVLEDLVLQAEIFLQYSMRSKALERLERISKLFPYEEEKNQKVQQLFLSAGFTPNYKGVPRPAGQPAPSQAPAAPPQPVAGNEDAVDNFARVTEITRNIYRQGTVKSVLFTTVNEVGRHWRVSRCIAGLCAPGKPPSAALEYCAPGVPQSDVMAIVKLIGAVLPLAEQRGVVSLPDAATSPELAEIQPAVAALDIRSLLAVPLMDGERIAGVLLLEQCGASRLWRRADIVVLKTIADQMVQAFQNARLRSLVKNLAVTDERSGLLKRSSYLDVLLSETRRAQQQQSVATVMLFYFGKASALVKECGEAAVKDMMLQIGQIVASNVRQSDMAVRYDLTTIAVILSDTNAKNAFFVADKMRRALAAVKVPGTDRGVTLTVGIAEAAIQHSFDPADIVTEVINRAEAALEIAKAEGGNKAHSLAPNLQPVAVA